MSGGPLAGLQVVELAGLGPVPHAAMVLGDLGAEVVRVERPGGGFRLVPPEVDPVLRSRRRSVVLDLRGAAGRAEVLELAAGADVLVEGFRPGVAERLGVGPEACCALNPRLVYGRLTGWGQDGPLAGRAGHDLTYLAVSGLLGAFGGRAVPPVVGDVGGGSMLLLVGVLAALWERERSGLGQVVDAAIVDGAGLLGLLVAGLRAAGEWSGPPGTNLLDGGAPFYETYACSDGRLVAVAALEPQFYAALLAGLGLAGEDLPAQMDRAGWPVLRARIAGVLASRPRSTWEAVFEGTDACLAPVLTPAEARAHPHAVARGAFVDLGGGLQAAPAPRFSRTPPPLP